jgi:hypothetical protein
LASRLSSASWRRNDRQAKRASKGKPERFHRGNTQIVLNKGRCPIKPTKSIEMKTMRWAIVPRQIQEAADIYWRLKY